MKKSARPVAEGCYGADHRRARLNRLIPKGKVKHGKLQPDKIIIRPVAVLGGRLAGRQAVGGRQEMRCCLDQDRDTEAEESSN